MATAENLLIRKDEIERRLEDLSDPGRTTAATTTTVIPTTTTTTTTTTMNQRVSRKSTRKSHDARNEDSTRNEPDGAESGPPRSVIPYVPKTDTHWDFVMKEMMWLGADFQGERKRQVGSAKKISLRYVLTGVHPVRIALIFCLSFIISYSTQCTMFVLSYSVKLFHKTKETRRLRELQSAEIKRRKLAARLGREVVKGWWSKIEKVITYKQKLQADQERQAAMNKQLVLLVQQTEKYTDSVGTQTHGDIVTEDDDSDEDDDDDDDDDSDNDDGDDGSSDEEEEEMESVRDGAMEDNTTNVTYSTYSENTATRRGNKRKGRHRRRHRRRLTIEEALAVSSSLTRRSKQRMIDYSRLKIPTNEVFYGSTASDASGSDASYDPDNASDREDSDNDSTLQQAIQEELQERYRNSHDPAGHGMTATPISSSNLTFLADPEELRKLREEIHMDIADVIVRLQEEGKELVVPVVASHDDPQSVNSESTSRPGTPITDNRAKHVSFADSVEQYQTSLPVSQSTAVAAVNSRYDADDVADASDVEDYTDNRNEDNDDKSEEGDLSTSREGGVYKETKEDSPSMNDRDLATQLLESDEGEDADEFEPPAQPELDDETTIEAEERLGRDMTYEEEMDILKRESEIPIEQLRAMYANAAANDSEEEILSEDEMDADSNVHPDEEPAISEAAVLHETLDSDDSKSGGDDAEEFEFREADAIDDETTIEAEEKMGRDMSYEEELSILKQESEMSVEELRAKYAQMAESSDGDEVTSEEEEEEEEENLLGDFVNDENDGGEEFEPDLTEVDDETTLEAEERMGRDMTFEDEMEMLKRENEIPVEELRAMYSSLEKIEHNTATSSSDEEVSTASTEERIEPSLLTQHADQIVGVEDDEEFEPDENAVDDETTMEAEERLGRDMSPEEEIALLKRESEMSVEELRQMYLGIQSEDVSEDEDMEEDDELAKEGDTISKRKRDDDHSEEESTRKKTKPNDSESATDDGLMALQALEVSAQRAQQTLASRPFLLASWVKLRHYQQVGLNWLVSLQSRRLNGVLADEMGLVCVRSATSSLSFSKLLITVCSQTFFLRALTGKDITDHHAFVVPRFLQRNLGPPSHNRANVSHHQLGD